MLGPESGVDLGYMNSLMGAPLITAMMICLIMPDTVKERVEKVAAHLAKLLPPSEPSRRETSEPSDGSAKFYKFSTARSKERKTPVCGPCFTSLWHSLSGKFSSCPEDILPSKTHSCTFWGLTIVCLPVDSTIHTQYPYQHRRLILFQGCTLHSKSPLVYNQPQHAWMTLRKEQWHQSAFPFVQQPQGMKLLIPYLLNVKSK